MRKKIVNKDKFEFREEEMLPPRRVNPKKSFQSRLAGKTCNPSVYSDVHERGFGGPKPHIALNQNLLLPGKGDIGSPCFKEGEKSSAAKDANVSSTLLNSKKRSDDPVLDEIVAKLKSGLQLGDSTFTTDRMAARNSERPWQNDQAGQTYKPLPPPSPDMKNCVCFRPLKLVMCEVCGETFVGRVSLECRVHPRALYLQDLKECKGCKQNNKEALKEYDLPQGMEKCVKKVAERKM